MTRLAGAGGFERANNFDALRLIAAGLVIFGHCFVLTGQPAFGMVNQGVHALGVELFFCISGYLVAQSWLRQPKLTAFARKRGLRIMPGLTANVILTACVLGPIASWLTLDKYFSHEHFWLYLANIGFYFRFQLPGVFDHAPVPYVVNGSLWSLPPEVTMYAIVAALGLILPRRFLGLGFLAAGLGLAAAYFHAIGLVSADFRPVFFNTDILQALTVMPFFMVGSVIAAAERRHRPRLSITLALLITLALAFPPYLRDPNLCFPAIWLIFPYAVVAVGTQNWPVLNKAARFGDLSYGLYLYAFPIQQMFIWLMPQLQPLELFAVALPTTLLIAFASWHVIERPALRLKNSRTRVASAQIEEPVLPVVAN